MLDRADGKGKVPCPAIGYVALLEMLEADVQSILDKHGLRRDDVHVHAHFSPCCCGICNFNSAKGYKNRREEGMVLARWTRDTIAKLVEADFANTASFEDSKECCYYWFADEDSDMEEE